MGQVIDKTAQILKLVAASQEGHTLKSLSEATGSKKPALCLMLQSLTANGFLLRNAKGVYQIGPLFFDLTAPRNQETKLLEAADIVSAEVNTVSGESVTVSTIRNGKYRRLISRSCLLAVRIAAEAPDEEHFYGNATGRILLANARAEVRLKIIDRLGAPSEKEWPEAAKNSEVLLRELEKIRRQGYAEVRRCQGEVIFLAVSTPGSGNAPPVAIGINVPAYRSNKNKLLGLLDQAQKRMSELLLTPQQKG